MKFPKQIISWFQKNGSTVLTCLGAGGVVATVIFAIKATPKAQEKVIHARRDKADGQANDISELPKLTALETVQACWKDYLPMAATGTATLLCIFGANVLDRKQQASMTAAYTILVNEFNRYREKVRLIYGEETDKAIQKMMEQEKQDAEEDRPPWDATQTFYVEGYPRFFESTMELVVIAEYCLNRNFRLRGNATYEEFLTFLGIDVNNETPLKYPKGFGWDEYIGETEYGYSWIDFDNIHRVMDDGSLVCEITFPFGPHSIEVDVPDCENNLMIDDSFPTCGIE